MSALRCPGCDYLAEATGDLPTTCPRCGKPNVVPISDAAFMTAFDAGDVCFCSACKRVHSGDYKPVKLREGY